MLLAKANMVRGPYPDMSIIPNATQTLLIDAFIADDPLKFKNPKSRSVDALWAQVVSPSDHINVLNSAFDLFRGLCEDRNLRKSIIYGGRSYSSKPLAKRNDSSF